MKNLLLSLLIVFCGVIFSCQSSGTGNLDIFVNGEDFVTQGFYDRTNWHISFDHVYVNIKNVKAFSTRNNLKASLDGEYWTDLVPGNSEGVKIGTIEKIAAGNYQSLEFDIARKSDGDNKDYSIVIIGQAEKEGQKYGFEIRFDEEMHCVGTEGYVGEVIKGIVPVNGTGNAELTFHFDHIFGDVTQDIQDHVNTVSLGMDFFIKFADEKRILVDQADIINLPQYDQLVYSIWTLPHLGEGHCRVSSQSSL